MLAPASEVNEFRGRSVPSQRSSRKSRDRSPPTKSALSPVRRRSQSHSRDSGLGVTFSQTDDVKFDAALKVVADRLPGFQDLTPHQTSDLERIMSEYVDTSPYGVDAGSLPQSGPNKSREDRSRRSSSRSRRSSSRQRSLWEEEPSQALVKVRASPSKTPAGSHHRRSSRGRSATPRRAERRGHSQSPRRTERHSHSGAHVSGGRRLKSRSARRRLPSDDSFSSSDDDEHLSMLAHRGSSRSGWLTDDTETSDEELEKSPRSKKTGRCRPLSPESGTQSDSESSESDDTEYLRYHSRSRKSRRPINQGNWKTIPAPKYDGTESVTDHLVQYELISELNGWNSLQKAMNLGASLSGEAKAVLSTLPSRKRYRYKALKAALLQRYAPKGRSSVYAVQLFSRLQRKGENPSDYAYNLRLLSRKAYRGGIQKRLLVDIFLRGLLSRELKKFIHLARPKNLDAAITLATEYEAFEPTAETEKFPHRKPRTEAHMLAGRHTAAPQGSAPPQKTMSHQAAVTPAHTSKLEQMLEVLTKSQTEITERLKKLEENKSHRGDSQGSRYQNSGRFGDDARPQGFRYNNSRPQGPKPTRWANDWVPTCFRCNKKGHFIRDCPEDRRNSHQNAEVRPSAPEMPENHLN